MLGHRSATSEHVTLCPERIYNMLINLNVEILSEEIAKSGYDYNIK